MLHVLLAFHFHGVLYLTSIPPCLGLHLVQAEFFSAHQNPGGVRDDE